MKSFLHAGNTDRVAPIFEQTVEAWEQQFRDNVITAFLAVKHAGKHMVAKGDGAIILTSSAASLRANGGAIAYSATKAGVNNLTRAPPPPLPAPACASMRFCRAWPKPS